MKRRIMFVLLGLLLLAQSCTKISETIENTTSPPSEVEKPLVSCAPSENRPVLAVMDFEIKASHNAKRELADGLSDMLVNALVETQCFRMVERSRIQDILGEIELGLGGPVDASSAAQIGKMIGAQALVMGTVTEFKENESGGIGGAVLKRVASGIAVSSAHVGFTIRIVDATTGEIYTSKSVDKNSKKAGLAAGGSVFGIALGGVLFKSKAMQDAVEQAIIETVAVIANEKERLAAIAVPSQPDQAPLTPGSDPGSCPQLTSPTAPRLMAVIPEVHIRRRVPDPAGETEIIRKFLEMGFTVVDQQQIAAIRYQERVLNAVNNPQAAAALGQEFGADIIVIGEAFSEFAKREGNLFSCRARVEAKAIQTSTGRILATNGAHASGMDIAELVAGKAALKNAGAQLADYFITQLCQSNVLEQGAQSSVIEIQLTNVNFRQMQQFTSMLDVLPGVENVRKQLTGNTARVQAQYSGSAEDLASQISTSNSSGLLFDITGLSGNKIMLTVTDEGTSQQSIRPDAEMIRQIQLYLTKLGYNPGKADGLMGENTKIAIEAYQQDLGLSVDGKASLSLLESLESHF